jgi:hypothetical protein
VCFFIKTLTDVGVLGNPLFPRDGKVEGINSKRNDGQQKPKQDATPKLEAVTVKSKSVTVDKGVSLLPLQHSANAEGSCKTQCDRAQEGEEQTSTNITPKTTCKSRHTQNPLSKIDVLSYVHLIVTYGKEFVNGLAKKW